MRGYLVSHHAHIIELNGNRLIKTLPSIVRSIDSYYTDEDIRDYKFILDALQVEHALEITQAQTSKNQKNERRLLFIGFNSITNEAQNTLLKALEEPTAGTSFVLIVPTSNILLDTVRSRCIVCTLDAENSPDHTFLTQSYKERLMYVKKLLEETSEIGSFYTDLEIEITQILNTKETTSSDARAFTLPLRYKHAILNKEPGLKYLLEEIALTLPLIKGL